MPELIIRRDFHVVRVGLQELAAEQVRVEVRVDRQGDDLSVS